MRKKLTTIRNNQIDILDGANKVLDKIVYLHRYENNMRDSREQNFTSGLAAEVQKVSAIAKSQIEASGGQFESRIGETRHQNK